MSVTSAPVHERRKFARGDVSAALAISLLEPSGSTAADGVNVSEGGLCLRLQRTLEVRSVVRLQVAPDPTSGTRTSKPVECTARVAWVIQRLDLRNVPPFLFDIGIEFINPPALLQQMLVRRGNRVAELKRPMAQPKGLEPAVVHGRTYLPRIEHVTNHTLRWHLVVMVDGVPCFSGHYGSEREGVAAWMQFKRRQARAR